MAWEQVQNVGEALPWGADMGALLDPLPCMGGGAPMTWECSSPGRSRPVGRSAAVLSRACAAFF